MAVAPDSSFTKRAIRFFIGLNSMSTWLVELTLGLAGVLRTATVDATLGSDDCGAVNSIAQIRMEPAVPAHSKCRIKALAKLPIAAQYHSGAAPAIHTSLSASSYP